jgi:DAPG hydrolase PhiG domain
VSTGYAFAEPHDLSPWQRAMLPIPARVEAAIAGGVVAGEYPFARLTALQDGGDGLIDGVIRNPDGTLLVACRTEMPGVTPEMWDWWFGWMGGSTARYKLWHPEAHISSAMERDQSGAADWRGRYVGNAHLVEEYIGADVHRLRIAFVSPKSFGFDSARVDAHGTAICGRSGLLGKPAKVGQLVHFVRSVEGGAVMDSRFFLGRVEIDLPLVGGLMTRGANRRKARLKAVPDQFGLDLLRHCAEEMNHLARFLPELFGRFGGKDG